MKNNYIIIIALIIISVFAANGKCQGEQTYRLGVLANRGIDECNKQWTPTAKYLGDSIGNTKFTVVPLTHESLKIQVKTGNLDFVITNPYVYVELEMKLGVERIATLKNYGNNQTSKLYGGLIFTKSNNYQIHNMTDLKNKSFAVSKDPSVGGFLAVQREWKKQNIDMPEDFDKILYFETLDDIVYAVESGKVDFGIVRTGVLENMEAQGKIDILDFKIINDSANLHLDNHKDIPFLHSTRLYPEWAFAKIQNVPDEISEKVVMALLTIQPDDFCAAAGNYGGWTVPMTYRTVNECLKELGIGPYANYGKITIGGVFKQYRKWIIILGGMAFIIVSGMITMMILNSHLQESQRKLQNEILVRKKIENEISKSRKTLRKIIDSMPFGVMVIDRNKKILQINQAALAISGYNHQDHLLGQICHKTLCPSHSNKCPIFDMGLELDRSEKILLTKDGKKIPILKSATKIEVDGEDVLLESFIDITDRKKAEKKLRNSISLLEATLNSTADGILVVGNDGKVKSYSKQFIEMWNIPADILDAKDDEKLMNCILEQMEDSNEFIEKIRYLYDNPHVNCTDTINLKDGRRLEHYSQPQIVDGKVEGRVWCFIDVTEKMLSEQKLKELNSNLRDSNEEIKEFLHVASHDMREPLRKISAFGSLLHDSLGDKLNSDDAENLEFVLEGSSRMRNIIEGLLSYSRIISKVKESEKSDVSAIIKHLVKSNLETSFKQANATINISPNIPPIFGDRAMLNQLFYGFLSNAIKYRNIAKPLRIDVNFKPSINGMVKIEIKDNGMGIKPEYQQTIFNIFKRLHAREKYEGVGMGLAMCKKIVNRHKGKIGIESEFGKGSTFWFTIPMFDENKRVNKKHVNNEIFV